MKIKIALAAVLCAGAVHATVVTLGASANRVALGHPVTFTLSVVADGSAGAAGGTVTFYDGLTVLGSAKVTSSAKFTTSLLPPGNRSIKAYYSGDTHYAPATSNIVTIGVAGIAQAGFQAPTSTGGVSFPRSIAVADFNGDGIADLVVDDFDKNQISVLRGKGDGTFQAAATYATQQAPSGVAVADFDRDGSPDIAVVNGASASSSISIFLNDSKGAFRPAVNYPVPTNPHVVAVADFNGDGIADLVTDNFTSNTISVLLGLGDGTFRAAVPYPVGSGPINLAVGDFNGDGRADVVVANQAGASLSVLLGNGDGTLQPAINIAVGPNPGSLAMGDFNGDGQTDIAVVIGGSAAISVLLGKGGGAFQTPVNYSAGAAPQSVAVYDVNTDGIADLIVTDSTGGNVNVLAGKADGTFQTAVAYPAGNSPLFAAVADLNGDGLADLVAANFATTNVSVLLGKPAPGPHIVPGGVVNAGLGTPLVPVLAANEIASVFGDTFAPPGTLKVLGTADLVNGRTPATLAGACVFVNGTASPIFLVTPSQINFQVPQVPAKGSVPVQVATGCGTPAEIRSLVEPVSVAPTAPDFFYFAQDALGRKSIAAVNAVTGAYIGPPGLIPGVNFIAAAPGDIVLLFFTGGGATSPSFQPGEPPAGIASVTGAYAILLMGVDVGAQDILYVGTTPGFPGLYQANLRIPAGTQPGLAQVNLVIGTTSQVGWVQIGPARL